MNKALFLLCCLWVCPMKSAAQTSKLQTRLDRALSVAYKTYDYELEEIKPKPAKKLPSQTQKDSFYKVAIDNKVQGYAYLGQAPSKERHFDYLLLFDTDVTLTEIKILIYRESYGNEIGTKRWLKQFIGMTPSSSAKFKENIDG